MAILIDAYNCVHAGSAMGGAWRDLNLRRLCQAITLSSMRGKITLVMDGRAKPEEPSENEFPELNLVYSGTGIPADRVIGQLVERASHRRNLVVVTNDGAVASHARGLGAKSQSCENFLSVLIAGKGKRSSRSKALPPQKTKGLSDPAQTERWLKEFGITPPPEQPQNVLKAEELSENDIKKLLGF